MIEIQQLVKHYDPHTQIGPLDFQIPSRSLTALIGPNGAGKTTLLTMLGRLLTPDAGDILIEGKSLSKYTQSRFATQVAILRQENHFMTRLTVKQLVAFGRFPYSQGRLTPSDYEIIDRYIDFLNLSPLADRYLDQLSGGQRQRAYVAMVLAQETPYILLDEPLNNLDIASSIQMMQHLRYVVQSFDRTIVAVLHDINMAARYADYIYAMKSGQLIHSGTPKEVITTACLQDVYGTQIQVIESEFGPIAVYA